MRYIELKSSSVIHKVTSMLIESYKLVEANISDDDLQVLFDRVKTQLRKEMGTNATPTAVRTVLSNHGFKGKKVLDKLLAGIDAPKGPPKEKTDTDEPETPTEEPVASEKPTPAEKPKEEPPRPSFKITIPADQAKKVLKNLSNQYPGIDQEAEDKIRSLARSAQSGIDSGDVELVRKALQSQLDIINAEIGKKQPKTEALNEFATGGGTSTGMGASLAAPLGAVIRRMPPGQSFFAPAQQQPKKARKKAKNKKKS